MELPILFALLSSFIITTSSHPKNSDIIPKDYYKRQVLQPIPGYIPVYIKADGEPLVRRESKKPVANVHTQKTTEPKEKNFPNQPDKNASPENEENKSGTRTEGGMKSSENVPDKLEKIPEPTEPTPHRHGHHDHGNSARVKPETQKTVP